MEICNINKKSCSYSYKVLKCRCLECKNCKRKTRKFDPKAKEKSRLWRLNNPERSRLNSVNYQKKHPEMVLKWKLKKYNMTVDEYKTLLKKQKYECAICKIHEVDEKYYKRLSVDHDHISKKIRGLLCGNCNTGLGKFKDDVELLKKAIVYINMNVID